MLYEEEGFAEGADRPFGIDPDAPNLRARDPLVEDEDQQEVAYEIEAVEIDVAPFVDVDVERILFMELPRHLACGRKTGREQ